MKKSGIIALWAMLLFACSDDKEDFKLQTENADLYVSEVVYIGITGSGDYGVSVSDGNIVEATVINSSILSIQTSYPFVLSLGARCPGTATVTVTDKASGRSQDLRVEVYEAGLVLSLYYVAYTVATPDTDAAREITEKIEKGAPFAGPRQYVLTSGPGSTMYAVSEGGEVERIKISHEQGGDGIYLLMDTGGGVTRRLRLDTEGAPSGVGRYLDFFGLDAPLPGTRNEITVHAVRFDEELTSEYLALYPDAEINEVSATYTVLLEYGRIPDGD
ncbi:MAG: hypothetical protein LIO85_01120 [Rikenellaceae bacterium]|nr:hypothetical protein [Rikenellaceae bacterium]